MIDDISFPFFFACEKKRQTPVNFFHNKYYNAALVGGVLFRLINYTIPRINCNKYQIEVYTPHRKIIIGLSTKRNKIHLFNSSETGGTHAQKIHEEESAMASILPNIEFRAFRSKTKMHGLKISSIPFDCAICFREDIEKVPLPCCGKAVESSMAYCASCLQRVCSFNIACQIGVCPTCRKGFTVEETSSGTFRCRKAKLNEELTPEEYYERYSKVFAKQRLKMDLNDPLQKELFWIAEEAMTKPLPHGWVFVEDGKSKLLYYRNERNNVSQWKHPEDAKYIELFQTELRKKIQEKERNEKLKNHKIEMEKMAIEARAYVLRLKKFNKERLPFLIAYTSP